MAKKLYSKEKILESAYELALEIGVKKISMRKLADRIGCSVMPIYEQFSSKEELLSAIGVFVEEYIEIDNISLYNRYNNLLYYGLNYPDFYLNIVVPDTSHTHSAEALCKLCYIMKKDERLKDLTDKQVLVINSRIDVFMTGAIFIYKNVPKATRLDQFERLKIILGQVIDSMIIGYLNAN
ncbi:MAG: TetR family transcriptional regulator [Acholeplasmataceae bacterium]|nr:TetR family transcriptional regulator [Acholeplasmataceae bacterium]